jgi:hypothetical protein
MVEKVALLDPEFFERVGDGPLAEDEIVEGRFPRLAGAGDAAAAALDAQLAGRTSLLVDYSPHAERTTADAVRAVLGALPAALRDDEALERALNPGLNRYRLETLQLSVPRPLSAANDRALETYVGAMERAWAAKNRLLELGVPLESALYLMPNAKALRFHETGSLLYLAHKWVMRTCFNAQEEIYRASLDELTQVRAVHPRLARHMGPPCVLRAGRVTPTCTEGEHFCGVPVWRSFPDVERRI